MKDEKFDTFEANRENSYLFSQNNQEVNFFSNDVLPVTFSISKNRHLNDYDSNILQEEAYKEINDDTLKLEYKISKTEKELNTINAQLQAASVINDYTSMEKLLNEKNIIENEYKMLLGTYNKKSISTKITDKISNMIENHLKMVKIKISGVIKSKLPQNIISKLEIKDSLKKLENINKSVDELMTLNIPYGENIHKYEQLSKYIVKANSIQSEIAKHIKTATKN